jgi:hypothetical protein
MLLPLVDEYLNALSGGNNTFSSSAEQPYNYRSAYGQPARGGGTAEAGSGPTDPTGGAPAQFHEDAYRTQKIFGSSHLSYISNGPVIKLLDSSNVLDPVEDTLKVPFAPSPGPSLARLPRLPSARIDAQKHSASPFNYHYESATARNGGARGETLHSSNPITTFLHASVEGGFNRSRKKEFECTAAKMWD